MVGEINESKEDFCRKIGGLLNQKQKKGDLFGVFPTYSYLCIELKVFYQRCNTKSVMDLWLKN